MDRRVISLCLSLSLMLLFASCSSKKVVSSSGDVASQAGQTKSEEIRPDAIKTVPLERSFDRPSGSATTPSGSAPSNLSLSPSTASGSPSKFHFTRHATGFRSAGCFGIL